MSNETLQAVRGMNDILPDEAGLWLWFEEVVRDWLHSYGYRNIRMPLVEPTDSVQPRWYVVRAPGRVYSGSPQAQHDARLDLQYCYLVR